MASDRIDLVEGSFLTEEYGENVEAVRIAIVHLSKSETPIFENALAKSIVPEPGASLNNDSPNVKVFRRTPKIVGLDGSNVTVQVTVEYQIQRPESDAPNPLRGGASLTQIETAKGRDGSQITVTHDGDTQGGQISVLVAQANFSREIIEQTDDPEAIQNEWIGKVNLNQWKGGSPRTWICSDVQYELVERNDSGTDRYSFTYSFEQSDNPDGWDPTVVYQNADGTIPEGLVDGDGIKTIEWYEEKDFNTKFSS